MHPDICIDEVLAETSASAERTFVRLWTWLDDQGRGRDNPKLIKAALYPLDDRMTVERVEEDLAELAMRKLLCRYAEDGRSYLSAKPDAWARWQRPQHPSPSKFPAPPACYARTHEDERKPHEDERRPHPVVVVGVGEGEVVSGPSAPDEPFGADFSACWSEYPRREGRKAALRAYQARRRAGVSHADLLRATRNYARAVEGVEGQYVKLGSTFYGRDDHWAEWVDDRKIPAHSAKAEPRW